LRLRHAGIVDQHRHGAELRLCRIEGPRDLGAISDIGSDRERPAARGFDLGGERLEPFLAPRHENDARAALREHERESAPKARGGAGDERHGA
jgi:hypothetical protein